MDNLEKIDKLIMMQEKQSHNISRILLIIEGDAKAGVMGYGQRLLNLEKFVDREKGRRKWLAGAIAGISAMISALVSAIYKFFN